MMGTGYDGMGWDTMGDREDGARLVLGYLGAGCLVLGGSGGREQK